MAKVISNVIGFSDYIQQDENGQHIYYPPDYLDDVLDYFNSEEEARQDELPWSKTHSLIAFRPHEVTLWLGMNGHGKSLALGQCCLALHRQRRKLCIASLEMKPVVTLARMWRQAARTNIPSLPMIRLLHALTDETMCLYDQQGMVRAETMIGVMKYCAEVELCKHFVLDSFTKCGIGEDDFNRQKWFIDQICTVARDTGMHIHVVAHSRKMADESRPPGKMDAKGSGAITDQVDNVLTWWRNKKKERAMWEGKDYDDQDGDALLICDKQRNGNFEGVFKFWFDPASLQFTENANRIPTDIAGLNAMAGVK